MRTIRIVLAFNALLALLLIAAPAYALPRLDERPTVPHPIPGRLDCVGCHGADESFVEKHQVRINEVCTMCHPIGDPTGIPAVPHPTQGQEECLACHAAGEVKPFPGDHTYQTNQVCLTCHPVSVAATGATPAATAATPPPATPAAAMPVIPHPTEGREDCLLCHGPGQVRPFPADHEGRSKESCLGCHQVSAAVTPAATVETPPPATAETPPPATPAA